MTADRAGPPVGSRSLPLAAVPFVFVALIPVVLSWEDLARLITADPFGGSITAVVIVLPPVAIPLFGAAIVIRHRSAYRTVPLLLFGSILLAIQVAGVRLYGPILGLLFDPSFPNEPMFELYQAVYTVMTVVGAFGWAYLASGLVRARHHDDVRSTGLLVVAAVVAAVIPTAMVAGSLDFTMGNTSGGIVLMALGAAGLVAAFAEKLAIGYLAVSATRGWLAAEAPRRGWGLAALGGWLVLSGVVMITALSLLGTGWFQVIDPGWIYPVTALYGAGGLSLLAGFALGLPDIEDITWYDLADLDAAELAAAPPPDPFDEDDAVGGDLEVVELGNRRLDR